MFNIKLNHINRPVADIAASRDIFAEYFGMKTSMELGRGALALMRDEGDMVLMLSHFDKSAEIHYRKDFHVGFYQITRGKSNTTEEGRWSNTDWVVGCSRWWPL
jgi:catechol 2,3-dioxygenase-like lactoylglutathione lyase family enzyme